MEITVEHVRWADRIASAYIMRTPPGTDWDGLRGCAQEALLEASRSFDPERGTSFKTWAARRILGAMLDESRNAMTVSRKHHEAMKRGETFTLHGREIAPPTFVSLDEPLSPTLTLAETVGSPDGMVDDMLDLRRQMKALPARERFALLARGYGYSQEEIGEMLAVSASRISQIQAKALRMAA